MRRLHYASFTSAGIAAVLVAFASASSAGAQTAGFSDVPSSHWASQSVAALAKAGILKGNSNSPLGGQSAAAATKSKPAVYDGNKPVTRYELAVTLYRFVQYIEHADKMRKTKFGAEALPTENAGPIALKRLIAAGYLPADSPLAKDTGKPVTANQFGDALAQVIEKSRENGTPISPDIKGEAPIEKPSAAPEAF